MTDCSRSYCQPVKRTGDIKRLGGEDGGCKVMSWGCFPSTQKPKCGSGRAEQIYISNLYISIGLWIVFVSKGMMYPDENNGLLSHNRFGPKR